MTHTLKRLAAALVALGSASGLAQAAEPEACKTVRMSDPGWTDITSTNAILGTLLQPLGYEQNVDSLAVPITFEALEERADRRLPRQLDAGPGGARRPDGRRPAMSSWSATT